MIQSDSKKSEIEQGCRVSRVSWRVSFRLSRDYLTLYFFDLMRFKDINKIFYLSRIYFLYSNY